MTNPQIEVLDTEISSLEKQISDNMNTREIERIQAGITSLKMEKQRLLSVDALAAPADIRAQIESIDNQISATEQAVNEATNRLLGGSPQLQNRLTSLKLQKQDLLSKLPGMEQVNQ